MQNEFSFSGGPLCENDLDRLHAVETLIGMWKSGTLGGEVMPEDVHPSLDMSGDEIANYFTLGMSLNFQRNSYSLWRSCTEAFNDPTARWVFDPATVCIRETVDLRETLTKYKIALQPNKHVEIWSKVCAGIVEYGSGKIRNIFEINDYDISNIRSFVRVRKTSFPYLNGPKICNYWLFVMLQYMEWPIKNREALSVAPDTHVIQGSVKLGLISLTEASKADAAALVASKWEELLKDTQLCPIDVHTPLWLWSRAGFPTLSTNNSDAASTLS